jgi:tetratricopeptide (TPR) repeat protein
MVIIFYMNQNIKKLRTYICILLIAPFFGIQNCLASRMGPTEHQELPVDQVVSHMEKRIISLEKEKYPWERYNLINSLANLHSHIYALKIDKVKVASHQEPGKAITWYPLINAESKGRDHYYRQGVYPSKGEQQAVAAKKHLQEAMRWYKYLIQQDSRSTQDPEIGLAWCLQQAGQVEEANKAYQKIYADLKKYLVSEKVTEILTYVFKLPFSEGMTHFAVLRNDEVISKKNIYLSSFVNTVVGDSHSDRLYFAKEADKNAIKSAIEALEYKFEEASIAQKNARAESVVQLYKRAVANAGSKEVSPDYIKVNLPQVLRAKELLVDSCRGARDAKCQVVVAAVEADPSGDVKVGLVSLYEGPTKFEKNVSTVLLSERKGPKKNYKFHLTSENGVIGEGMEQAVPSVESNESYGPAPVDFTISSRRNMSGYGEAMFYYSQLLDKTKKSKELEEIRQALWVESKKAEKAPHVIID